ncbi:hypothetical protein F5146DRAFT_1003256 [Armillaria mellea]|nr:hypothetical protein F5146DRAFT_1003256 [Armillaria mellea]
MAHPCPILRIPEYSRRRERPHIQRRPAIGPVANQPSSKEYHKTVETFIRLGYVFYYVLDGLLLKAYPKRKCQDRWSLYSESFKSLVLRIRDEGGFLYIKDRIKDIIIPSGESIAPGQSHGRTGVVTRTKDVRSSVLSLEAIAYLKTLQPPEICYLSDDSRAGNSPLIVKENLRTLAQREWEKCNGLASRDQSRL